MALEGGIEVDQVYALVLDVAAEDVEVVAVIEQVGSHGVTHFRLAEIV